MPDAMIAMTTAAHKSEALRAQNCHGLATLLSEAARPVPPYGYITLPSL